MARTLQPALYEDASMGGAIRVHHRTLLDFIQRKLQNGFAINLEQSHELMLRGCLTTMHRELQFNNCRLSDALFNKDVLDLSERMAQYISEALRYSALFCLTHFLEVVSHLSA